MEASESSKLNPIKTNDTDFLLRRLNCLEKSISMFGRDFEICFYNEELKLWLTRRDIVEALNVKIIITLTMLCFSIRLLWLKPVQSFVLRLVIEDEKLDMCLLWNYLIAEKTKSFFLQKIYHNAFFLNKQRLKYDDIYLNKYFIISF